MTRHIKSTGIMALAAILTAALFLWGCSSDDNKQETKTSVEESPQGHIDLNVDFSWEEIDGQFLKFYYQPVDSIREKAPALMKKTGQIYSTITFSLQNYDVDTLHFFCFAGLKDMLDETGLHFTTLQGDSIFYGYGPVYGDKITDFVMDQVGHPKYLFMEEGLPLVFDFSRRNFHQMAYDLMQADKLAPVATLVDNAAFSALDAEQRGIEAASLSAFLLTQWGPVNFRQKSEFRQVYDSQDDFATAAQVFFGVGLDEIEQRWHDFLPTQTDEALNQAQQKRTEDGK